MPGFDEKSSSLLKPTLFVGSSKEALPIAEAIFGRLKDDAVVHLWDTVFAPSESSLKALQDATNRYDFAVFVFTADDITISQHGRQSSPRDNVTFELGLFMGALGPHRTFIAFDREEKPKLPSDLAGITVLSYPTTGYIDPPSAVVEVASTIKRQIRELGVRSERIGRVVYLCGPHAERSNLDMKAALEGYGFTVKLPNELLFDLNPETPALGRAAAIRRVCCEAIKESDIVVVNVDSYGLDSAWEMGYAEALGKHIVGYNPSDELMDVGRVVNRWPYYDNYMHGWEDAFVSEDLDEIAVLCEKKITYLFCPYRNEAAIKAIADSAVKKKVKRLIVSNEDLGIDLGKPATYSWRARKRAVQLLREADVILTVLPRYGMDTAWKLGYAAALGKQKIGWLTDDFGTEQSRADYLDHWMHGWRKKPVVGSTYDLAIFVRGLHPKST